MCAATCDSTHNNKCVSETLLWHGSHLQICLNAAKTQEIKATLKTYRWCKAGLTFHANLMPLSMVNPEVFYILYTTHPSTSSSRWAIWAMYNHHPTVWWSRQSRPKWMIWTIMHVLGRWEKLSGRNQPIMQTPQNKALPCPQQQRLIMVKQYWHYVLIIKTDGQQHNSKDNTKI